MGKIIWGCIGLVFTVVVSLWGAGTYAEGGAMALRGAELPDWLFFLLMIGWFIGDIGLIVAGAAELRHDKVVKESISEGLANGDTPEQALGRVMAEMTFAEPFGRSMAKLMLRRLPYKRVIERIVDEDPKEYKPGRVIKFYQALVNDLETFRKQIHERFEKAGARFDPIPRFRLPAVEVTGGTGWFSTLRTGDTIIRYDGQIVATVDELHALTIRTTPNDKVPVHVMRVQTVGNQFEGFTNVLTVEKLDLKGGPIQAELKDTDPDYRDEPDVSEPELEPEPTHAQARRVIDEPMVARRVEAASTPPLPVAADLLRFLCPECGKRLKAPHVLTGRTVKCSKCLTPVIVPLAGTN